MAYDPTVPAVYVDDGGQLFVVDPIKRTVFATVPNVSGSSIVFDHKAVYVGDPATNRIVSVSKAGWKAGPAVSADVGGGLWGDVQHDRFYAAGSNGRVQAFSAAGGALQPAGQLTVQMSSPVTSGVLVPELSTLFLAVTVLLLVLQSRLLGSRQFTTVAGRGYRVRPLDLGRWRYLVAALVYSFVFFSTIVPLITLGLASLMQIYGFFGPNWLTPRHYQELFSNPKLLLAIGNTVVLGAAAALLVLLVTLLTSYAVMRTRLSGRGVLDLLTWIPVTVPGIVLAVGMTWAYLSFIHLPFPFYGTLWMLIVAVAITLLPISGRLMNGTMVQISAELEEAARVHGASFVYMLRRVLVPLLGPAMLSGWLVMFALSMKNFVTVSLLYTPGSIVLSALQYEMWNGGEAETAAALGTINMLFSLVLVLGYLLVLHRRPATSA